MSFGGQFSLPSNHIVWLTITVHLQIPKQWDLLLLSLNSKVGTHLAGGRGIVQLFEMMYISVGAGMQQGQPHPVPIPYPYYGVGMYMGMPYSQQMGPKPASGGGFPTGSATTFPPSTTAFGGYEDQEYRFPTSTSVKTGGVTADGFKHQVCGDIPCVHPSGVYRFQLSYH